MSDTKYVTRELHGPEADLSRRMMEVIELQADIIQRYARHTLLCPLSDYGVTGNNNNCTCGASAALAALRKLQEE